MTYATGNKGRARPTQGLTPLVEAAQAGSVAAFERLYRLLVRPVVAYLRRHRASDPDGLANDVFTQVHLRLGTFDGDEQGFRSWVFTIAHHRMIDDRRRQGRQPELTGDLDVSEHRATGDVEEDAFAALATDRVRDILAPLSTEQQRVVMLRVVADLSVEDVARILGKREGAVKAMHHRAITTLRRDWAEEKATSGEPMAQPVLSRSGSR